MHRLLPMLILLAMPALAEEAGNDDGEIPAQTLTEEELENLRFRDREGRPQRQQREEDEPVIEELSVGQRYLLKTQREEIKQLIARDLGVMSLQGDESDLDTFQALHDRRILKDNQVKEWQSVGILFGDILTNEFEDLEWVSYEDDRGASKALQWRDTQNFVFPVTVFSKRLEFGERLDTREVYEKIKRDIESFIEYEQSRVKS